MSPIRLALACVLLTTSALVGCFRDADDVDTTGTVPPSGDAPAAAEPASAPVANADAAAGAGAAADGASTAGAPPVSTDRRLHVTAVDVGKSVGTDNRVTTAATAFDRNDTIYVSVATDGSGGNIPVTAKWTYQDGEVVDTETRTVANAGPAVTAFRVSKPEGWPTGRYQVQISVSDEVVATRDFAVR